MPRPKRNVQAAAEESTTPPGALTSSQSVARVIKAEGNNLYSCALPSQQTVLVELATRFRNTIWIKRGGYVPKEFAKATYDDDEENEESVVGQMPPSDSEDED
ncbi:hypothetical protein F5Y07DRAFT_140766 [Xylaria sp. FL0933]|nr:hypothetical protein F5Y07DRAFT_140766 [Xylaria sp. FL0933]